MWYRLLSIYIGRSRARTFGFHAGRGGTARRGLSWWQLQNAIVLRNANPQQRWLAHDNNCQAQARYRRPVSSTPLDRKYTATTGLHALSRALCCRPCLSCHSMPGGRQSDQSWQAGSTLGVAPSRDVAGPRSIPAVPGAGNHRRCVRVLSIQTRPALSALYCSSRQIHHPSNARGSRLLRLRATRCDRLSRYPLASSQAVAALVRAATRRALRQASVASPRTRYLIVS